MKESLMLTLKAGEEAVDPKEAVDNFAGEFVKQFPVISIILNSKLRREMELLLIRELKKFFQTVFIRENCGSSLSRMQIDFQSDLIACGMAAYAIER